MSKRSQFDKQLEEYERKLIQKDSNPEDLLKARNKLIAYHYHNVERSRGTKVRRA